MESMPELPVDSKTRHARREWAETTEERLAVDAAAAFEERVEPTGEAAVVAVTVFERSAAREQAVGASFEETACEDSDEAG